MSVVANINLVISIPTQVILEMFEKFTCQLEDLGANEHILRAWAEHANRIADLLTVRTIHGESGDRRN